jgi:hypothetical protein
MKIKLTVLAVAAVLAGCAEDQQSNGESIHRGESRAQVEAKLGRPSETRHNGDGQLVCIYSPGEAKMLIPIIGELSHQQEYTVRYSHGVVVSWDAQTESAL